MDSFKICSVFTSLLAAVSAAVSTGGYCLPAFDGTILANATLQLFDTTSSPYSPTHVKGNNLNWSSILLFPTVPISRFDWDARPRTKAVEITINNSSIFLSGGKNLQYGFRRAELVAGNGSDVTNVGVKTFHWSNRQDAERPMNLSHEYMNVWHEANDYASNQFSLNAGVMLDQDRPVASGNASLSGVGMDRVLWKVLDRKNDVIWSTPILSGAWQNWGIVVDYVKNTLQVYYSANYDSLVAVTNPVPNDNSGGGQFHVGMLKKPTNTTSVVWDGYQESPFSTSSTLGPAGGSGSIQRSLLASRSLLPPDREPRTMARAEASSGLSMPREEAAVSFSRHGYLQTFYHRFSTLLGVWAYRKEECPLCRPYFASYSLSPNAVLTQVLPSPEEQGRCHGCWVLRFAISFCAHIIKIEKKGEIIRASGCYINSSIGRTEFIVCAIEERDGYQVGIEAHLEMLKTTQLNKDSSWVQWISGFLEARWRGHQPIYIERAFETHPISGYTGSSAAFEKIYSWFQVCSTSHQACNSNFHPPSLPTRVIDITDRNNMRLIEGEDSQSHYICLSHRWIDEKKMPRCTQANIKSLKQHIPWNFLTQSFQDAISFAQAFSKWHVQQYPGQDPIRYIWIDSLCIIQDSAKDWDKEARLMGFIYEGAILTVAAASGTDGCFSEAEQIFKGFEISNPQRRNPRLYLRKGLPYHGTPALEKESNTAHEFSGGLDLFTRGWVMQERLLSRRLVIFSPHEIMWECFEISDCECGRLSGGIKGKAIEGHIGPHFDVARELYKYEEQHRTEDPNYLLSPMPFKVAYHMSLKDGDEYRMRKIRDWWRRLVDTYSSLSLTKESDRLPALTGLATWFGRTTGMEDYIIGHWMASLPFDLAWCTYTPADGFLDQDRSHPVSSWSWASCAGPVQMPREATPEGLVVCAKLNSVSPTFGSSISLNIRCSIFTATTDHLSDSNFPLVSEYLPDSASSLTVPANKRMYALILNGVKGKYWALLHIQIVHNSKLKFRRLGLFLISARENLSREQSEVITNLTLRSCFNTEVIQEIELI
ncbi:hypothetical protein G7Y89_g12622 [Cudoniella acicularis]|uniref:Heterokaryon incompatibility domain-containing protein n=1 Tax=Cudoniella acicularis TaxID=354080 RepID=A0A8H4VYZ8_9HELO|nr:hypothetical protein G7Y89_g12622 [Cudoniella acicularis]